MDDNEKHSESGDRADPSRHQQEDRSEPAQGNRPDDPQTGAPRRRGDPPQRRGQPQQRREQPQQRRDDHYGGHPQHGGHPRQQRGQPRRGGQRRHDGTGIGRRTLLLGGGGVFLAWFLFLRDDGPAGGGYDDPERAVEAFVEHVQAGNTEAASGILYGDQAHPMDLLGSAYDTYANDDLTIDQTNTRSDDGDRAEIEFLYYNNDYGDPTYRFGSLFFLRNTGEGWKIHDFDGSYIGGRFASG